MTEGHSIDARPAAKPDRPIDPFRRSSYAQTPPPITTVAVIKKS
jgi:hypothetical protein